MGEYTITWRSTARKQYIRHLRYALQEFGSKTLDDWVMSIDEMEKRLEENPKSFSIVPLLRHLPNEYRGCFVMKNFQVIYTFDELKKVVYILMIWDMRMNPERLRKQIKR